MKTKDFYYELPKDLIAQCPAQNRQMSKLLVLARDTGLIDHKMFYDLPGILKRGDCLVLNDTRVIPARLIGYDVNTGSRIEILLVKETEKNIWEVLVKPVKRAGKGNSFVFGDGLLKATILGCSEEGIRYVSLDYEGDFGGILDKTGILPLPPYIKQKPPDQECYQTVYSKEKGSIAAPTAGLHFTAELLNEINSKGIDIAFLTLHVGLGTFIPVKTEFVEMHKMHNEYFRINIDACDKINKAKTSGGRIIAVGTTVCRVLEAAGKSGTVYPEQGWTDIFIYPGHKFRIVNALLTNFHLPCSTLIMLVSAFGGRESILHAYNEAIRRKYRFYSFGDAMFIF